MKALVKILLLSGLIILSCCSKSSDPDPDGNVPNNPPNNPNGNDPPPQETTYEIKTVISGLRAPQGIEIDAEGRLWVAEQGVGADDGSISVIDTNGEIHPFLTNIPSSSEEGSSGSAHHLLIEADTIWSVVGITSKEPGGDLLKLDYSDFTPGDPPLVYDQSLAVANVASLTLNHSFINQTEESNAYNLTLGPDGNIYIVDAAANAVVKYDRNLDQLEVVAELPKIPNSTTTGPPQIDAVPTGIIPSEGKFLVSAFVGFPFNEGDSRIFEVSISGDVSVFESDFTGAVDLTTDGDKNFLLEYGRFSGSGFQGNSGKVIVLENDDRSVIAEDLSYPTGICLDSSGVIYVALGTGSIINLKKK